MNKTVTLAAWSGTGKTTYLEQLLRILSSRGIRVAVIKHTSHEEAFFLGEGRDSDRHFQAGAVVSALTGPSGYSINSRGQEPDPEELIRRMDPVDLIITEGYKSGPYPKIELRRSAAGKPPLYSDGERLALVTDGPETGPRVFPLDRPEELADFLQQYLES